MSPLSFYNDIRINGELIYMEHLNMQSPNIVSDNMAYIAQRWPECLTEAKDENGKLRQVIDFDKLRQALSSDTTGEGQERYQFTWPDKRHAIRMANTPTTSTLRPCREDSVDFDHTQNLYIEGDNLEVLKLLRESYLGKVKMIYIDPPYNTGGDFVYKDNFIKKNSDYAEVSGAYDEEGNQIASEFEKNADTNGRFHTDWLNMIYPRLKVARDLLSEDGVIFISIDDNEAHNLRKVCDEVFGEKNFVAQINWRRSGGRQDSKYYAIIHEYILCYAKDISNFEAGEEIKNEEVFPKYDNQQKRYYKTQLLRKWGSNSLRENRPNLYYPIKGPDGSDVYPIIYKISDNSSILESKIQGRWRWGASTLEKAQKEGRIEFLKNKFGEWVAYEKIFAPNDGEENTKKYSTWIDDVGNGTNTIKSLFSTSVFDYSKSAELVTKFIKMAKIDNRDIVLDFFSGSATTAHAVMQLNAEDGGNRKYIMVQLPEVTDEKSEAYKAGYKNICEIGKERIRRAGKKIKEEHSDWKGDTGFRVLKVDSSNMEDVFYTPAATDMQNLFADNIKADRTDEDLLLQVMMELGIALSEKIEKTEIAGKTVWNVNQGYLMACFEPNVSEDTITAIAKQQPQYFVMADRSLASDNVADNFEQLFEEYSPTTIRRIL